MYKVTDIDNFIKKIKKITIKKFKIINDKLDDDISKKINDNIKDIDSIINDQEVENIIYPLIIKKGKENLVTEESLANIVENINNRIISNSIAKLVSEGNLESAYDEKLNDFIFW